MPACLIKQSLIANKTCGLLYLVNYRTRQRILGSIFRLIKRSNAITNIVNNFGLKPIDISFESCKTNIFPDRYIIPIYTSTGIKHMLKNPKLGFGFQFKLLI